MTRDSSKYKPTVHLLAMRWLARLAVTAAALAILLYGVAWVLRPQMDTVLPQPDPDQLAEVETIRTAMVDPENPLRLHVPVDYAAGAGSAWQPRGQSPLLAELVNRGALPPVDQRTGPQPCVYRGVEGTGSYGGVMVIPEDSVSRLGMGYSACGLVRWSPQGDPVVPHVARSWDVSEDHRVYTFYLREGMRWSDGEPFTADDIMYWWEHEATDPQISASVPPFMQIGGRLGRVEKIDRYTVRFTFQEPHGLFLQLLATAAGRNVTDTPEHYLRQYHPTVGNQDVIAAELRARRLPSARDVYKQIRQAENPSHPRLWPWVYHTYRSSPPYRLVRNPYYWMVDTNGNQLPYIDAMQWVAVQYEMAAASIASGRFSFVSTKPRDLTLLMDGREGGDYRVYRWIRADASDAVIHCNLNRRIDPDRPVTRSKHELLSTPDFRKALSLAIDRAAIIDCNYHGETTPAQCGPGPESRFYNPDLHQAWTQYDPDRANSMLNALGLTRRDSEGFRTDRQGRRMTFFLNHAQWFDPATALFIAQDWKEVGIRTIPRMRQSRLFYTEKAARKHDFTLWTGANEYYGVLDPRVFLPISSESNFAIGYANWYLRGGMHGDPNAIGPSCVPIPEDHPLRKGLDIYQQLRSTGDQDEQARLFGKITDLAAENLWTIGICTSPRYVVCVDNDLRNVPQLAVSSWAFRSIGNAGLETWYLKDATLDPALAEQIRHEILTITPAPDAAAGASDTRQSDRGSLVGSLVKWAVVGIALSLVLMLSLRHPFVARRLIIMIPTLLLISIIVFTIIQLPPGDFLTSRIMELKMRGEAVDQQELDDIRQMYHLDEPMVVRYTQWLGLNWFVSFSSQDEGLLQGNLGRSMANDHKPVNQIVGDRIVLTFLISLGTILFTWAVAVPVGIFSAVKQYSIYDYIVTFVGFVGMCIPGFLLALLLMFFSQEVLGVNIDRLFSEKYALQPHWDIPKFLDLLKHIWAPVLILGITGTAGMVRVMRANLLDELKKPYVVTARAKGVRPLKLLLKYPVRLALNPFISGIGGIFPRLISGGTLVAVVLSLPTVGPLMLQALLMEDTMLAGSMLMVLSLLGVLGVLVSDLLLLWLDPRIRFEGGTR